MFARVCWALQTGVAALAVLGRAGAAANRFGAQNGVVVAVMVTVTVTLVSLALFWARRERGRA